MVCPVGFQKKHIQYLYYSSFKLSNKEDIASYKYRSHYQRCSEHYLFCLYLHELRCVLAFDATVIGVLLLVAMAFPETRLAVCIDGFVFTITKKLQLFESVLVILFLSCKVTDTC